MFKRIFPVALVVCAVLMGAGAARAATFGNTSGSTNTSPIENSLITQTFTLSENATATSMTAAVNITSVAKKVKLGIWRASDSLLVAYTEEKTVASGTNGEVTFNFVDGSGRIINPRLYAGDYRLGAWSSSGVGFGQLSDDNSASSVWYNQTVTYGNHTISPNVFTNYNTGGPLFHIFVTYTAGLPNVIGDSVVGYSTLTNEAQLNQGVFVTPAQSVKIDSVAAWVDFSVFPAASLTKPFKMALYNAGRQDGDSTLIDTSTTRLIETANNVDGWYIFQMAAKPTITASDTIGISIDADTSLNASISIAIKAGTSTLWPGLGIYNQGYSLRTNSYVMPSPMSRTTTGYYQTATVLAWYTPVSAGGVSGRKRRDDDPTIGQHWRDLPMRWMKVLAQGTFAGIISDVEN